MEPSKIIHAAPCEQCRAILSQLGAIAAVDLPHADCQMVFNQAVRVIAQHPEYAFVMIASYKSYR